MKLGICVAALEDAKRVLEEHSRASGYEDILQEQSEAASWLQTAKEQLIQKHAARALDQSMAYQEINESRQARATPDGRDRATPSHPPSSTRAAATC